MQFNIEGNTKVRDVRKSDFAPSALVIEDDPFSQKLFSNILLSYVDQDHLAIAKSYDEAVAWLMDSQDPKLVIMDVFLGEDRTGVDLYRFMRKTRPNIPIIMTSALDQKRFAALMGEMKNPPPFLHKPFQPDDCKSLIAHMLEKE